MAVVVFVFPLSNLLFKHAVAAVLGLALLGFSFFSTGHTAPPIKKNTPADGSNCDLLSALNTVRADYDNLSLLTWSQHEPTCLHSSGSCTRNRPQA